MSQPQVFLVTGGNSGLGYQSALELARHHKVVVIGARNQQRLDLAVQSIKDATGNKSVLGYPLDLGSLSGVQKFAQAIKKEYPRIDGLILNAGIVAGGFAWSLDGLESTFATNHLGHFYLTELLLPNLTPTARIVVTSSGTHDPEQKSGLRALGVPLPKWNHPDDIAMPKACLNTQAPKYFSTRQAYSNSKLANVYFTYHLADLFKSQGSQQTVVAYDPGFCSDTSIARSFHWLVWWVMSKVTTIMFWIRGSPNRTTKISTAAISGAFQARLAYDDAFAGKTGVYYSVDGEVKSSALSYDKAKAADLWDYSEQLVRQLSQATANS
eukprot:jgi/Chrzof1/3878/Cz13g11320.t1